MMNLITLSNQIQILAYPIADARSVTAALYIKAGSCYEQKEQYGIAHFLEHMHFQQIGTMSQRQIYEYTQKIGTALQGYTFKDAMCFTMKVRPKYMLQACTLLRHLAATYEWNEDQAVLERSVVLSELREKTAYTSISPYLDKIKWREHPRAHRILGNPKTIQRISLADLIAFKRKRFAPGNISLVLTGNFSADQLKAVQQELESLELTNQDAIKFALPSRWLERKPDIKIVNYGWAVLDVCLAFDVENQKANREALYMLNAILGAGDNSLLSNELKERRGWCWDIYSDIEEHFDGSHIHIHFSINKDLLRPSLQCICQILRGLKSHISDRDIELIKPFYTDNLWFWMEDSQVLNEQIAWDVCINGSAPYTLEEKIKAYQNIHAQQIFKLAGEIFQPNRLSMVLMGDIQPKEKSKIRDMILQAL